MSTSKNFLGQEILISYLSKQGNKSYQGFLKLYHNDIIALPLSFSNWKDLDDFWALKFLKEAENLLNKSTFNGLKKKVIEERLRYVKDFQTYWQSVIKEHEKENLVLSSASHPKRTIAKDFPEVSQPVHHKNFKKNIKLNPFCYEVLFELKNRLYSYPFYDCIDSAEKLDYFKIIKYPMDLSTINSKLENNQYTIVEEFEKDICLIFSNCYAYNDVGSEIYYLGKALESVFNKKWTENPIFQELKRVRDDIDTDSLSTELRKKQRQILENNENELQMVNNAFLVTLPCNNLVASNKEKLEAENLIPRQKKKAKNKKVDTTTSKSFVTSSSKEKLEAESPIPQQKEKAKNKEVDTIAANEPVLQAIVESLLPLRYRVPELSLVMNGKKQKGFGRFGYSDMFVLKENGHSNISLELKYISLVGLVKEKVGANELEQLDKILEKEKEELLLKRQYTYQAKDKKIIQTTIGEILNGGIIQLQLYMDIISKGQAINYSSSGVFDERIRITKSVPNKLKGFVILVIGFRRILWKPVKEVTSNYIYNKI